MTSGFVGIACLDLRLPRSATLKDRRSALAHVRRGLEQQHGAAVAEVGGLDDASLGELTAAVVAQSQAACEQRLAAIEAWAEDHEGDVALRLARIVTPEDLA